MLFRSKPSWNATSRAWQGCKPTSGSTVTLKIFSMVGWAVYLLMEMVASRVEIAALVSALCIATMSHILARVLKAPVSNFLIPGILPIVPGGSIYRCAYAFIKESSYLSTYMNEALKIAGSIALAIFFVDSVFKLHLPKRIIQRETK